MKSKMIDQDFEECDRETCGDVNPKCTCLRLIDSWLA